MTHIERVDLNLLAPLAALLEERHVSRAAEVAGMSQPAMSRALQRLRDTLGDELLVRTPGGYRLTPRAERVQRQLRAVLPRLERLFAPEEFDPAQAAETFRVAGTDYSLVFAPTLFQRFFRESPRSTLHFRTWHDAIYDDLDRGVVDLVFVARSGPTPTLHTEHLFDDRFACVMSADHPLAERPEITLEEYLDATHVVVGTTGEHQTAIDRRLEEFGTRRRAGLTVPYHSLAALSVLGNHLILTLPTRLLTEQPTDPRIRILPAPKEIRPLHYQMAWHPRLDGDIAQRWLRNITRTVTADLPEPTDV
ncbi:LysR family transcriptional regulator [Nocardia macrotermitis]|uniref:PCP degradation transcriptional activation protein n=1 Tax=Nocardia macrotermitis TaxID=2585198 RepID=A0A7K0D7B4_9NOCA|nr:LysR family transcriptional regulator [Nocardia macrotermitis]MQY21660.1 PCP degradation transcriptional activation protein [Nocardia macrotermitis]